jgi:peptidoglycan LD-endopeptidase LytH
MKKWVRRIVLGAAGLWLLMLLVTHPTAWALLRWSASPKEMIVPVSGVTPSSLTGSFGAPRSEHRKHAGIDIFARRGTRVLAAAPGKVIRVGHNRLGGKVVWVAGAGAQLYYYAHLDQFSVQRGDTVQAGDPIGRVGNTGNAATTPPHLHFAIYPLRRAFRPVDPAPILKRLGRRA